MNAYPNENLSFKFKIKSQIKLKTYKVQFNQVKILEHKTNQSKA